jgi:S1-C subfamily serine protease
MTRWMTTALLAAMLLPLGALELAAQRPAPAPPPPARAPLPPRPPTAELPQQRGWLGMAFQFGVQDRDGSRQEVAWITDVYPDSPAARAGVQRGDTIVQLNGRADVQWQLREWRLEPGDTVRLRLRREGGRDRNAVIVAAERPERLAARGRAPRSITVPRGQGPRVVIIDGDTIRIPIEELTARVDSVTRRMRILLSDSLGPRLRELERQIPELHLRMEGDTVVFRRGAPGEAVAFGFDMGRRAVAGAEFAELNPELAEYFRGAREGVLVLRVAPETPAARAGLESGDVVVRANGAPVRTIAELRRAITRAEHGEVRLDVVRRGAQREVRLRWER